MDQWNYLTTGGPNGNLMTGACVSQLAAVIGAACQSLSGLLTMKRGRRFGVQPARS